MRWIRGTANAILVATLIRPIARRLIARARQRAREHPVAPLLVPAEGLLEAVLLDELSAARAVARPDATADESTDSIDEPAEAVDAIETDEAIEEAAGRGAVRTLLLIGLATATATSAAVAITTIIRRRREARARAKSGQTDYVAIPVDAGVEAEVDAEADLETTIA